MFTKIPFKEEAFCFKEKTNICISTLYGSKYSSVIGINYFTGVLAMISHTYKVHSRIFMGIIRLVVFACSSYKYKNQFDIHSKKKSFESLAIQFSCKMTEHYWFK